MTIGLNKEFCAGVTFIAIGGLYGLLAWSDLPIGVALNMGPGYVPLVLSGMLAVLGVVILGQGIVAADADASFGVIPWRGIILLSLATIFFAAFVEKLGLLPGVFVTTFLAALANPRIRWLRAALTSLCIALFCTAVFAYGIRLPLPVIGDFWRNWGALAWI